MNIFPQLPPLACLYVCFEWKSSGVQRSRNVDRRELFEKYSNARQLHHKTVANWNHFSLPSRCGQKTLNKSSLVECLWELRIKISMLSVSSVPLAARHWRTKATSTCITSCTATSTLAWRLWTARRQMPPPTDWCPSPSHRKYSVMLLLERMREIKLAMSVHFMECVQSWTKNGLKLFFLFWKLFVHIVIQYFKTNSKHWKIWNFLKIKEKKKKFNKHFKSNLTFSKDWSLKNIHEAYKSFLKFHLFVYLSIRIKSQKQFQWKLFSLIHQTGKTSARTPSRLHWTLMLVIWMATWVHYPIILCNLDLFCVFVLLWAWRAFQLSPKPSFRWLNALKSTACMAESSH